MAGTGMLIGRIFALIMGIIVTVGGSAAQSYTSSDRTLCDSGAGQRGQFLSQDARSRCTTISATNSFGGIAQIAGMGLAIVGIILIAGGVQKVRVKKTDRWLY